MRAIAILGLLVACGQGTQPCRSETRADGALRVTCPDGSSAVVPPPGVPEGCVLVREDQHRVAVCADGTRVLLSARGTCLELEGSGAPACRFDAATSVDVSGVVRVANATSHEGATVTVERTGISAVTDASGSFTLRGVPAGFRVLRFDHEGLASQRLVNAPVLPGVSLPVTVMRPASLVVPGFAPYFFTPSQDGAHLAVPRGEGGFDVIELATGFRFALPGPPTFRPDGRWAVAGDYLDLQLRRLVDMGQTLRVEGARHVVWHTQSFLGALDLTTGDTRLLEVSADTFALDDRTSRLAYVADERLHLVDLVSGKDELVGLSREQPVVLGPSAVLHVLGNEARVVRGDDTFPVPDLDPSAPAVFSPDGARLLYQRRGGAQMLLRIGGAEQVLEPEPGGSAVFLGGGARVAHWGRDRQLELLDVATRQTADLGPMVNLLELASGVVLIRDGLLVRVVNAAGVQVGSLCSAARFGGSFEGVHQLAGGAVLVQDCQDRVHLLDTSGIPTLLERGRVTSLTDAGDAALLVDGAELVLFEPGRAPLSLGDRAYATFDGTGRYVHRGGWVFDRQTRESRQLPESSTWFVGHRALQLRGLELWSVDLGDGAETLVETGVLAVVPVRRHLFFTTYQRGIPGEAPLGIWRLEVPP